MKDQELLKKINGKLLEIDSKTNKDTFHISGGKGNIGQQNIETQIITYTKKDFTIKFEYDCELKHIINIDDVYADVLEYSNLKEDLNLNIELINFNHKKIIQIEVKKRIKEFLLDIEKDKKISKTILLDRLENMEIILFNNDHINNYLQNTLLLLEIFKKKFLKNISIDEFNILDLIQEYPDVEFYCMKNQRETIVEEIEEFIRLQILQLIEFNSKPNDYSIDKYKMNEIEVYLKEWNFLKEIFENKELGEAFLDNLEYMNQLSTVPLSDINGNKFMSFKITTLDAIAIEQKDLNKIKKLVLTGSDKEYQKSMIDSLKYLSKNRVGSRDWIDEIMIYSKIKY